MSQNSERGIRITALGARARIERDGERIDPSSLTGYTISHHDGESSNVLLHVGNYGATEFEGLAQVVVAHARRRIATGSRIS